MLFKKAWVLLFLVASFWLTRHRWIASDKSSRIPLSTFLVALRLHAIEVEPDEVECMVANMIYRVRAPHACHHSN